MAEPLILGMTGFGRGQQEADGTSVAVELRTVNHRFSEVQVRLPRLLAGLEPELRRRLAHRLGRGRADLFVKVSHQGGEPCRVELNQKLVQGIRDAAAKLVEDHGFSSALSVGEVLRFPEVLVTRPEIEEPGTALRRILDGALEAALQSVEAMRRQEGALIVADLVPRLDQVEEVCTRISRQASGLAERAASRLRQRIQELLPDDLSLEPARLEQEVAMLADRSDITEEMVRLQGFVQQARSILTQPEGSVNGRRLDFLLQEMNREVNTIGSKAGDAEIGAGVVAIKQELERVREQVQNIA